MKSAAAVLACVTVVILSNTPAGWAATIYETVPLPVLNDRLQNREPAYPEGEVVLGGVPFDIPTGGNNCWWSGTTPSGLVTLVVPVHEYGVQEVHTLIQTGWGVTGWPYAWVEFVGSEGAYYRKDLYGNVDIRDWYNGAYTNSINGTTTIEVWSNGQHRLDKQQIVLPAAFHSQVLTEITLSDDGATNFQRTYLEGVTVVVPESACAEVLLAKIAGAGTFTQIDANSYTLDLGSIEVCEPSLRAELELTNSAAMPADDLAGTWSIAAPDFHLSGFEAFGGLAAGSSLAGLVIELDGNAMGDFSGQVTLMPTSENAGGSSEALPNVTITISGSVTPMPGDADSDGDVDFVDYITTKGNFGTLTGAVWSDGDFDGDGDVDFVDYITAKGNFGKSAICLTPGAGGDIPEPATLALVVLGGAALLGRSRRRAERAE